MAKGKAQKQDELIPLPDGTLSRKGAVPVKVSARVVRAGTGTPLRDLVHFYVRQRGLNHFWEPRPDARGSYVFEPRILRPGVTWFEVFRICYGPCVVRARVEANGHVKLGTVRLRLDRATPGTIGVLPSSHRYKHVYPVELDEVLLEGPADEAGLREMDQLLEVDGKFVDVANAERLLRGSPGTTVTLKVRRYLSEARGTRHHVRPRVLMFEVVRAPGRPGGKRHPMWRA